MNYQTTFAIGVLVALAVGVSVANAKGYKGHKFRGAIEEIEAGKITIRDRDEDPIDFLVTPETDITRDDRPASFEELQLDDVVVVTAKRFKGRYVAIRIFAMEPQKTTYTNAYLTHLVRDVQLVDLIFRVTKYERIPQPCLKSQKTYQEKSSSFA